MDITVIGVGYVGTVAAANLAAAGHSVVGIDIDPDRVELLQSGSIPFHEPGLAEILRSSIATGCLRFAHSAVFDQPVGHVALVAVGTPQAPGGGADLNQVASALPWIKARRRSDTVIVMKSTVPPGAGQRMVEHDLAGTNPCYVANPEFLREGHAVYDWQHPDRIVIGANVGDAASVDSVRAMHVGIDAPYVITDITSAEMIKYASNAFLATRISFINEIASLCDRVGASIDDVSGGLALDPRTGGRMYAGVGYGGSCFPKDVRALDHLGLANGVNLELLRAVINVNNRQRLLPLYALREQFGGNMSGVRVAVLGLAFKPNTDDVREAPAIDLIRALVAHGAMVTAYDPQATANARKCLPGNVRFAANPPEAAVEAQAVVVLTEWEECVEADWDEIARRTRAPRFLFDGRNALVPDEMQRRGFEYVGIGERAPESNRPC